MLQNTATTEYKHKIFVERIVEFDRVWALENEDGFSTSTSNDNEDIEVITFWSDKAYAKSLAKEDWANYQPTEITLAEFIENWLVGMHNDKILVGTNWDANMFGKEIKPLRLALEIVNELSLKSKSISLTKFSNLTDYKNQVTNALNNG